MKRIIWTVIHAFTNLLFGVAFIAIVFGILAGCGWLLFHSLVTLIALVTILFTAWISYDIYSDVDSEGNWNP